MHIQVKQVKDIKRELIFTKKENVDNNYVPCPVMTTLPKNYLEERDVFS